MSAMQRVLYCHCAYAKVVPVAVKNEVLQKLTESGIPFDAVPDLCELSAQKDPVLQELASGGNLKIAACYPRAVKWLFDAAGVKLNEETTEILNMRTETATDIVDNLLQLGIRQPAPEPTS